MPLVAGWKYHHCVRLPVPPPEQFVVLGEPPSLVEPVKFPEYTVPAAMLLPTLVSRVAQSSDGTCASAWLHVRPAVASSALANHFFAFIRFPPSLEMETWIRIRRPRHPTVSPAHTSGGRAESSRRQF